MHNILKRGAVFLTALMLGAPAALAVPLVPGGVIFPTGTTSAARPELGGVVQNDNLIPFTINSTNGGLFTTGGNVQNRVALSTLNNTLIFAPRIRDTFNLIGPNAFFISAFQLDGYAGWMTDVDFRTDGLGDKGFTSVSRSATGDLMTFRYDDPLQIDSIAPGLQEESLFPSILTDATDFALTGTMTIFGFVEGDPGNLLSVTVDGIAVPVAPIPLPAGGWLLLMGLAGLAIARRRNKTA